MATIVCSTLSVNAKIRRVGYFGNQIANQDYPDVQSAETAASTGDTLLIFPGSYATANFGKRLIVIGYGYYVSNTLLGTGANDSLQATLTGTLTIGINFNAGSDTTILEGLDGLTVNVNALVNDVLISRCNCALFTWSGTTGSVSNWQITQSFVTSVGYNAPTEPVFLKLTISNCVLGVGNGNLNATLFFSSPQNTGTFSNNIFLYTNYSPSPNFNNGGYSLVNNIFITGTPQNDANCTFTYNIASGNAIPSTGGDLPNVNLDSLFVGYPNQGTYSNDALYALAPNSPAKGAGIGPSGPGTTDCGIFGGTNPYHLSGIPAVPSFYILTGNPFASTNPYTIYFSVRGNN